MCQGGVTATAIARHLHQNIAATTQGVTGQIERECCRCRPAQVGLAIDVPAGRRLAELQRPPGNEVFTAGSTTPTAIVFNPIGGPAPGQGAIVVAVCDDAEIVQNRSRITACVRCPAVASTALIPGPEGDAVVDAAVPVGVR